MSSRGQFFSQDLLSAAVIFMLSMGALTYAWSTSKARMAERRVIEELEHKSWAASAALAETPGEPEWWEDGAVNVTSYGLASVPLVLSADKVSAFRGAGVDDVREALRLGSSRYHLILRDGGRVLTEAGERPSGEFASSAWRVVSYGNGTAVMEFTVWDNLPGAVFP